MRDKHVISTPRLPTRCYVKEEPSRWFGCAPEYHHKEMNGRFRGEWILRLPLLAT